MTVAMKPLFWHQGLFLQPQHFQQEDLYARSLLFPFQTFIQPYFWGVCEIRILESALKNQVLEITGASLVFRDGAWVTWPGNSMLQSRSFKGSWVESDKPLTVYLGLRRWDGSQSNVTVLARPEDLQSANSRYVSPADPENVDDLYQHGPEAKVKYLYHLLRIFWESEIDDAGDYDLVPVARLEFDGHDTILSRQFAPPSLTISCSDIVLGAVKSIREQVVSRCRLLEEYKQPKGMQIQEGDSNGLTYLLFLRSLSRYAPLLYQITETPDIHPWNAYSLIRQLVGELSTFTDRIDFLGKLKDETDLLPAYDHEDIGRCFTDAQMLVEELLSQIMIGAENIIYLRREADYFTASISAETFDNRNAFYLMLRTSGDNAVVAEMIERKVKVSSGERMPLLVKRALSGMPLDQLTVLPPGLPRRGDSLYFKLDRGSVDWTDIQKHGNICLYWNGAPEDTTGEIIIMRR